MKIVKKSLKVTLSAFSLAALIGSVSGASQAQAATCEQYMQGAVDTYSKDLKTLISEKDEQKKLDVQKKNTQDVIARLKESYPARASELTKLSADVEKSDSKTLFLAIEKLPDIMAKNCPQ